jgi:DNA-binding protein YbaB
VTSESVDRLGRIRDDLDVDAQRFERAQARLGALQAADTTGVVRVQTDADGLVTRVDVDAQWREHLTAESLAGAVLDAYTNTVAERSRLWAESLADDTAPAPAPRPAPSPGSSVAAQLKARILAAGGDDVDVHETVARLTALVDELDRSLDEGLLQADQLAGLEHEGASSARHVRARVSGGGALVGVAYNEAWLTQAHPFNIGRETTEAIHAALRALVASQETERRPMDALLRLAQDPSALAEYLGITDQNPRGQA